MAKIIAPCLAAGCTCVYKTNEYTPLNVLRCAELLVEAGLPAGVVNFVNGTVATGTFRPMSPVQCSPGQQCFVPPTHRPRRMIALLPCPALACCEPTGELISNHMDIDKVFFTGSVRAGKAIATAAAQSNLKGTCLELGGKSPHIVISMPFTATPQRSFRCLLCGAAWLTMSDLRHGRCFLTAISSSPRPTSSPASLVTWPRSHPRSTPHSHRFLREVVVNLETVSLTVCPVGGS